jgi:hypothetical protein
VVTEAWDPKQEDLTVREPASTSKNQPSLPHQVKNHPVIGLLRIPSRAHVRLVTVTLQQGDRNLPEEKP